MIYLTNGSKQVDPLNPKPTHLMNLSMRNDLLTLPNVLVGLRVRLNN